MHQIDDWTANIYARTPLRNKFGNHTITITTRDLGVPSNIVTKTLDICISDFNDHPPVFVTPLHNTTLRIPENTTVGTQLLQVVATDEDIGMNALVRYRLKPDPLGSYKIFQIDSETGQLFLKEFLNREKQKIHEVRWLLSINIRSDFFFIENTIDCAMGRNEDQLMIYMLVF